MTGILGDSVGSSNFILRIWAKTEPHHPLLYHLMDVGCVASRLLLNRPHTLSRFSTGADCPSDDVAMAWLSYLAALHDIGKCHAEFQGQAPEEILRPLRESGLDCALGGLGFRHEAFSADWVFGHLMDGLGWTRPEAWTVASALRGHHGNFQSNKSLPDRPSTSGIWQGLRASLESSVRDAFIPPEWAGWRPRFADHSVTGLIVSGLVVLSDWIASNEELFPRSPGQPVGIHGHEASLDEADTLNAYIMRSHALADASVARLGLDAPLTWSAGAGFCDIWRGEEFSDPRPIQVRCEELCRDGLAPGFAIIEAPMGEGKTEAAIYLATQWLAATKQKGFYVALPTAATSNQMYTRVRSFLETHDPTAARFARLVHGMAWLLDRATPQRAPEVSGDSPKEAEEAAKWFEPRKRSLLASYGVGTVDQALMGVLHVRHGFLRLLGLAEKVLIVDEVHAYDAYTTEILTLLLQWCGRLAMPVILLSATLPASRRKALLEAYREGGGLRPLPADSPAMQLTGCPPPAPYPLLTLLTAEGHIREESTASSRRRTAVRLEAHREALGNPETCARLVAARAVSGGCFCVIANTVNSAQSLYRALETELRRLGRDDIPLTLFHARFRPERRLVIEEAVLRAFDKRSLLLEGDPERTIRPERAILVATQVVEQSLDIDFDEMFTEVAPIDLILQRAGRLHRHARVSRPTGVEPILHVLLPGAGRPDFGSTERVYHRFPLLKTLAELEGRRLIELPGDIRGLVDRVYDDRPELPGGSAVTDKEDLREAWSSLTAERADDAEKAKQYLVPPPTAGAFRLGRVPLGPFDEDEGDANTYFAAKTRLGDETQQVLLLDDESLASGLGARRRPDRDTLARLLMNRVSLPSWWFRGVSPVDGYAPPEKAPPWLLGTTVLRLADAGWSGRDKKGVVWTIRDDEKLGVIRFEARRE